MSITFSQAHYHEVNRRKAWVEIVAASLSGGNHIRGAIADAVDALRVYDSSFSPMPEAEDPIRCPKL